MNEWFDTRTTNEYENGWFGTKEECIEMIKGQATNIIIEGLKEADGIIDWYELTTEDKVRAVQAVLEGVIGYGLRVTDAIRNIITEKNL